MQEISKIHVGLDVHKDSISVAVADPGRVPARLVGKVIHDVGKLLKVLVKIGPPEQLHLVYEAGPTDFGLQRALAERGYCCEIIAPSQIQRRAGDRVKTDGRDSIELAECSRAGQLSAIWVPDPEDEAIRDLSLARDAGEAVAPDALVGDVAKEALNHVQPRCAGGREVDDKARVSGQPLLHFGMVVRGVVVHDQMQAQVFGRFAVDQAQ